MGISFLIEKLPKNGMSKRHQKFLPHITREYLAGKPAEQLKKELNKKHKGFVDVTYDRLGQVIKMNGLEKISSFLAEHPRDLRDEPIFADAIIRYCIRFGLKKEIFEVFNQFGEKEKNKEFRDLLYKKYRNGNKGYFREALEALAKEPSLYLFIMDKILKKN